MRTPTILLAFCLSGVAAPALAANGPIASFKDTARRVANHLTPGGRTYLKALEIERSAGAEAALRAHYGLAAIHKRSGWHDTMDLKRDNGTSVDTAAVTQHLQHPIRLVTDVSQVLDPNVEHNLRSMGFQGGRGEDRAANRLSMTLYVKDPEVTARLGYEHTERYAQRVSVDYEKGKPVAAYVLSYSFPPRGMPGMNEENIRYSVGKSGKIATVRVLMNTSIGRTVALPFGVNSDFYETTLNRDKR